MIIWRAVPVGLIEIVGVGIGDALAPGDGASRLEAHEHRFLVRPDVDARPERGDERQLDGDEIDPVDLRDRDALRVVTAAGSVICGSPYFVGTDLASQCRKNSTRLGRSTSCSPRWIAQPDVPGASQGGVDRPDLVHGLPGQRHDEHERRLAQAVLTKQGTRRDHPVDVGEIGQLPQAVGLPAHAMILLHLVHARQEAGADGGGHPRLQGSQPHGHFPPRERPPKPIRARSTSFIAAR